MINEKDPTGRERSYHRGIDQIEDPNVRVVFSNILSEIEQLKQNQLILYEKVANLTSGIHLVTGNKSKEIPY